MKTLLVLMSITPTLWAQVGSKAPLISMPKPGGLIELKNCTVTAVEPDGVRVSHDAGFAKVPYAHLPDTWKAAVPYDRERAEAFQKERENAHREALAQIEQQQTEGVKMEIAKKGTIITATDVKVEWLKQANPENVSGLYVDPTKPNGERVVSKVGNGLSYKGFTGAAALTDSQKAKKEIEEYRAEILAGKHDRRAEIIALEHNLAVYAARGDTLNVQMVTEQLKKLKRSQ